jgi:hypothetical protein
VEDACMLLASHVRSISMRKLWDNERLRGWVLSCLRFKLACRLFNHTMVFVVRWIIGRDEPWDDMMSVAFKIHANLVYFHLLPPFLYIGGIIFWRKFQNIRLLPNLGRDLWDLLTYSTHKSDLEWEEIRSFLIFLHFHV